MTEILFHAIKSFVNDLGEFFSGESHSLALYERLINKTTIGHTEAVEKHISAFRKFCVDNRDSITSNKETFNGNVEYSPKVYIDMNSIFKMKMDSDTRLTIHRHLLTLSATLDSQSSAKDVLKTDLSLTTTVNSNGASAEDDFLSEVMAKVEKSVDANATNPNEAISKVMSSGIVNDLVSSIGSKVSSGNLDINKMFGSIQKMLTTMAPDASSDPQMAQTMSMINGMMSMMGK